MDEFDLVTAPESMTEAPKTEFYIATVTEEDYQKGYKLQFAGETTASDKYYKYLYSPDSPPKMVGQRVVVMKQSGTYVIIGRISVPGGYSLISTPAAATSSYRDRFSRG